jgi:hypothetical protein
LSSSSSPSSPYTFESAVDGARAAHKVQSEGTELIKTERDGQTEKNKMNKKRNNNNNIVSASRLVSDVCTAYTYAHEWAVGILRDCTRVRCRSTVRESSGRRVVVTRIIRVEYYYNITHTHREVYTRCIIIHS